MGDGFTHGSPITPQPKDSGPDYERLEALQQRQEAQKRFLDAQAEANKWMREHSTDELVAELRKAREDCRPMRIGTINTLILLTHIDRLASELAKEELSKP